MSKRFIRNSYIATAFLFVALIVTGTFLDYSISEIISVADGSSYIANNSFAKFFEITGSVPLYAMTGFGTAFIAAKLIEVKNKTLRIPLILLCAVATVFSYTVCFKDCFKYIAEHNGVLDEYKAASGAAWGYSSLVAAGCAIVTYLIAFAMPKSIRSGLFAFGLVTVISFAISQGLVQGLKPIFGRQRYRMIKVLEYNGLSEYVDYTEWFIIRGNRKVRGSLSVLGIASDGYKSFPSGHTCSAAMSLCLIGLAEKLGLKGKSYAIVKTLCCIIGVGITVTVAYTRIVMGAHYLTDVTFGAGFTIFAIIISEKLVKTLVKKIKI